MWSHKLCPGCLLHTALPGNSSWELPGKAVIDLLLSASQHDTTQHINSELMPSKRCASSQDRPDQRSCQQQLHCQQMLAVMLDSVCAGYPVEYPLKSGIRSLPGGNRARNADIQILVMMHKGLAGR